MRKLTIEIERLRATSQTIAKLQDQAARLRAEPEPGVLSKDAQIIEKTFGGAAGASGPHFSELVEGRIVFTPDREARRSTFEVPGTLATFFSGIVCPHAMASPTGFEPVFWP